MANIAKTVLPANPPPALSSFTRHPPPATGPRHLPFGTRRYFLARLCRSGSQAPFSRLLATDCWMKYIPSTPSLTLG